ncbi:thiamine biosynthesis protein ThiF [Burkholderia pseudomallei]|uniref:thiamine biosynthesis protein ThiF n=1 Tax=Burkholderia pseudomallei TaxID=28450 RepID=UPI0005E7BEEC|nr:thiamine biosynthesis protein ThiF [Burkholderia pseudomallei]CPH74473.1 Uncharacterised protein [Burkholderia pseudomallei]
MDANSFHRLAKVLADSGEASTIEDALASFSQYGVRVVLHPSVADSVAQQVIALTAINIAARSFMGNVFVHAPPRMKLLAPGFEGQSLETFLAWAGVTAVSATAASAWPSIQIGTLTGDPRPGEIRPWANGWSFGVGGVPPSGDGFFAPACVAAGGFALSEAFSMLRRDNPYAGRRTVAFSLWNAGLVEDNASAPLDIPMPSTWLVGLGHLGQAYAWTMGFMKPADDARFILQDVDTVTASTLSTSALSCSGDVGAKKTRVVAQWLEDRGYATSLVERRFDEHQRIAALEPRVALFGVDNAAARRVMEGAGFALVVDAGLGAGHKDFRAIRVRTFPGPSLADALWATDGAEATNENAPAYREMVARGADPCGVTTLASRSVGAPFVGCVAAGFTIAQRLRYALGEKPAAVVDLNLRAPEMREVIR